MTGTDSFRGLNPKKPQNTLMVETLYKCLNTM